MVRSFGTASERILSNLSPLHHSRESNFKLWVRIKERTERRTRIGRKRLWISREKLDCCSIHIQTKWKNQKWILCLERIEKGEKFILFVMSLNFKDWKIPSFLNWHKHLLTFDPPSFVIQFKNYFKKLFSLFLTISSRIRSHPSWKRHSKRYLIGSTSELNHVSLSFNDYFISFLVSLFISQSHKTIFFATH